MKIFASALACLLICGSVFADDKKPVVVEKVKVVPKVGVVTPHARPLAGKYYWRHPTYGWGYWYYPAPTVAVPANYYLDEIGRVVPNGYAYDVNGNLVPLPVAAPVVVPAPTPVYTYPYHYGRWGRWGWWR